ncbi:MAG: ThuA domain-containing protein [Akkermansiaceae bacterium]|nr:ThuA domain-containing protein [Akkermansiaceae bacterium]
MKLLQIATLSLALLCGAAHADDKPVRILFFSKSSGFEHEVIKWKKGELSYADKVLQKIGKKQNWEFEFSKDGSKFNKDYLKQFNTVIFYTTGDLTNPGKDKHPPMTHEGVKALFDYINQGGGFVGLHCASDTFHSMGKVPKYHNHDCKSDFICMVGGEFAGHGKQQTATNRVINPEFPGYENIGDSFSLHEEWYALKNINPDMHALTVIETEGMKGNHYKRPPYPTSWARMEGKGRVYYNAMGHREDVWDGELFQNMIIGAVNWTMGKVDVEIPTNLEEVAPDYMILKNNDK